MKKINQNEWTQERMLAITSDKIYNIHKLKAKRIIQLKKLSGLSINLLGKKPEFTLHINEEYDYRFMTDK